MTDSGGGGQRRRGLGGAPIVAVRYAWGTKDHELPCSTQRDPLAGVSKPCAPWPLEQTAVNPGAAPILAPISASPSGLPANPFLARITPDGRCECIAPQKCR